MRITTMQYTKGLGAPSKFLWNLSWPCVLHRRFRLVVTSPVVRVR